MATQIAALLAGGLRNRGDSAAARWAINVSCECLSISADIRELNATGSPEQKAAHMADRRPVVR
ncbi:MAG TPA: hypothetical protein VFS58_00095 [Steroidobacteraceae bacterium]|nr:hypothetical protein [Steroidobacteraceae bacterium]